jgi:hypothetical protein
MTLWKYEAGSKNCLAAGVQRCNEGMAQSKDQSFLFREDVRHIAHAGDDA